MQWLQSAGIANITEIAFIEMIRTIDGNEGRDESLDGATSGNGGAETERGNTEVAANSESTGGTPSVTLGTGSHSLSNPRGGMGLRFGVPAEEISGAPLPYPNLGLTCYAGALSQGISALIRVDSDAAVVCSVFRCRHDGDESCPSCIQCAYKKVLTDHRFNRSSFLASLRLLYDLQSTLEVNFRLEVENDPSEYLHHCLLKNVPFTIDNPIIGSSHIEKTCLKCGYRSSVASEAYGYLILPVAMSGSIEDVIAATRAPETVPDVYCQRCRERTAVSNQKVYETFPRYLFVFITQYRHVPGTLDEIEISKHKVVAAEQLDLSHFGCAGLGLHGELISSIIHTRSPNHYTAAVKALDGRIIFTDDSKPATVLQPGDLNSMPVYGRIYIVSRGEFFYY